MENEFFCEVCQAVVQVSVNYGGKMLLGSLGAAGTFGVKNPWGKAALFVASIALGHLADVAGQKVCGKCGSEKVRVV